MLLEPIRRNAEHFLRRLAPLGPVRLVFRNCAGFAEMFCSTERLRFAPGWLNLHLGSAHLHVVVTVVVVV